MDGRCEQIRTALAAGRPYRNSPEPAEDLMQVGYVGLLKSH
jgi:DNA-directed RNA polymerase specialized sigma subunit